MSRYVRHFTVEEANALLPQLRAWLAELRRLDRRLLPLGRTHAALLEARDQYNVGGRELSDYLALSIRWQTILATALSTGVQIKDLDRGLCDFPHRRHDGGEVLLCWQASEPSVGYWHGVDDGFAGRQPLAP